MISLIDADIVAYRCAAVCEGEPIEIAKIRCYELMQRIINDTESAQYQAFLTGDSNFRNKIYPEYKAHRKTIPKPKHLNDLREYLVVFWGATVTDGYEADDALGMCQIVENSNSNSIICTIDKDLLMIPGNHYNFVKQEFKVVNELEGLQAFYRQMLIGDTSDNIFGVNGIGKVKAAKIIDSLTSENEMIEVVKSLYEDNNRYLVNADCLWIWRKEGEKYSDRNYT